MSEDRRGTGTRRTPAAGRRDRAASEDWQPLADRIAGHVRDYLDGLAAVAASEDIILPGNWEPDVGADPDLDTLRAGLAARLREVDDYAELFDPYEDIQATRFRLSDDLAAVAADLIHGMQHYQAGRADEALWWWQFSYVNHWGTHGGAALRALHAVVAHARLDVAEEVPGQAGRPVGARRRTAGA